MPVFLKSSMLVYAMAMLFMFSVVYTLAFYFHQGDKGNFEVDPLGEKDNTAYPGERPTQGGIFSGIIDSIFGAFDWILEAISWFSFFAPFKLLLFVVMKDTGELYNIINLLLLRPIGWIGTYITTEWVLDWIRGRSE